MILYFYFSFSNYLLHNSYLLMFHCKIIILIPIFHTVTIEPSIFNICQEWWRKMFQTAISYISKPDVDPLTLLNPTPTPFIFKKDLTLPLLRWFDIFPRFEKYKYNFMRQNCHHYLKWSKKAIIVNWYFDSLLTNTPLWKYFKNIKRHHFKSKRQKRRAAFTAVAFLLIYLFFLWFYFWLPTFLCWCLFPKHDLFSMRWIMTLYLYFGAVFL